MSDPALELLSVDDVVDALTTVSKRTVEGWIETKQLASVKIGSGRRGIRRVTRLDLNLFVAQHKLQAKRPDWLTPEIDDKFTRQLNQIVERVVERKLTEITEKAA